MQAHPSQSADVVSLRPALRLALPVALIVLALPVHAKVRCDENGCTPHHAGMHDLAVEAPAAGSLPLTGAASSGQPAQATRLAREQDQGDGDQQHQPLQHDRHEARDGDDVGHPEQGDVLDEQSEQRDPEQGQ